MATAITEFSNKVAGDVPGAPSFMVDDAVISAMIDFCRRAKVWGYDHDNILLLSGINEYELSVPDGTRLHEIDSILNEDGDPVYERNSGWLDANVENWRTETGTPVEYYTEPLKGKILVVPVPKETVINGLIGMRLLLIPERNATTVDDFLYGDYLEAIVYGAKAILLQMPGKPWTSRPDAMDYKGMFEAEIKKAHDHLNRGATGKKTKFGLISYS